LFLSTGVKQLASLGALEIMMSKKRGVNKPGNVIELKEVSTQGGDNLICPVYVSYFLIFSDNLAKSIKNRN